MTSELNISGETPRFSKLVVTNEDPIELLKELTERNPRAITPELQRYLGEQGLRGASNNENGEDNE